MSRSPAAGGRQSVLLEPFPFKAALNWVRTLPSVTAHALQAALALVPRLQTGPASTAPVRALLPPPPQPLLPTLWAAKEAGLRERETTGDAK